MSPYIDTDTGELYEGCPHCAESDAQVSHMEGELRVMRGKITRLQNQMEAHTATKRDKKEWAEIIAKWQEIFPNEPKLRSASIKSARATEYFQRQDHGALPEDVVNAFYGARERPYLTYGRRTATASPNSVRAVDIADICAVKGTHADKNFDLLVALGAKAREQDVF